METRAHYVAVGTFVLAMIVVAFIAVLWLARAQLTTQYKNYYIFFQGVTGLSKGAPVNYTGVPVGRVIEIELDPDKQVRVTVEIDASVELKTNDRASVETNILSGVSYIQLGGGTKDAPPLVAQAGERYPVIRARRTGISSLVARAPELLQKLDDALDHVNDLLDEKNRQAVSETLDNIRVFTAGLAERRQDLANLIANANTAVVAASTLLGNIDRSYVGPDGLGNRAATALADFDSLAKNLSDTNRQLQAMLADVRPGVRTFSQQTLNDVGALVSDARQLISGLNRLTDQISRNPSQVLFGDRREGYHPK